MVTLMELLDETTALEYLLDHPVLEHLDWFRDASEPVDVINRYIETESPDVEMQARGENLIGPDQCLQGVRTEMLDAVSDYLSLIRDISEFMCERTIHEFPEKDLVIVQIRARFDFDTWLVRIMFVIDAPPEKTQVFSRLLAEVEQTLLTSDGLMAELEYANKRDTGVDWFLVRREYPFVGNIATGMCSLEK